MKFTPTQKWLTWARAVSKTVKWDVFVRSTNTINLPLNEEEPTEDEAVVFAGILNRQEGIRLFESTDIMELDYLSYDDHASRITAENTVHRPVRIIGGISHLILGNIPGIYVWNANVEDYELTRAFHNIEYKIETKGVRMVRLNSGRWVELNPNLTSGSLTLGDAGEEEDDDDYDNFDTIRVQVHYVLSETLTGINDQVLNQSLIQLNDGDVLPYVWYQRIWVFRLLEILTKQAGAFSYDFDDFRIKTFDDRYETSYFEIPPGDTIIGNVNCMKMVGRDLFLGIESFIYRRNMDTHIYTKLGQAAGGFQVVRLFTETVESHNELIIISRSTDTNAYRLSIINLEAHTHEGWTLTNRGTYNDLLLASGFTNFAYVKDPTDENARGLIFYMKPNGDVFYFDLETKAEVDINQFIETGEGWDLAGWSTGNDYWCQWRRHGALVDIYRVYYQPEFGTWTALPVALNQANIGDGIYNPEENVFVHSGGTGLNLWVYDHSTDENIPILSGVLANNFHYRGMGLYEGRVYFHLQQLHPETPKFAYIQNNEVTIIPTEIRAPFSEDFVGRPYKMVFDHDFDAYVAVFSRTNILFQHAKHITMFLEGEGNFERKNLKQAINDICAAFNLALNMTSTKEWIVRRRINDFGDLLTSGESITLNGDDAQDITEERVSTSEMDIVQVSNDTNLISYDGTNFVEGKMVLFVDQRVVNINRSFFPTYLLKDLAFYFYKFFSRLRKIYRVPGANISPLEYEPFDGAVLQFSDRRVNADVEGVIVGTEVNKNGNIEFEVMTFED